MARTSERMWMRSIRLSLASNRDLRSVPSPGAVSGALFFHSAPEQRSNQNLALALAQSIAAVPHRTLINSTSASPLILPQERRDVHCSQIGLPTDSRDPVCCDRSALPYSILLDFPLSYTRGGQRYFPQCRQYLRLPLIVLRIGILGIDTS
jgi:hypothetical protein